MTTSPAWDSSHDLPETTRLLMIALLNQQLADLLDLQMQAKQAHWNVKGPQFESLHTLFDEAAETFTELADELAERAVELGGFAMGTLQLVGAASRIPAYDPALLAGDDHLRASIASVKAFAGTTCAAIQTAADLGDATTSDVFTEVSRAVDKLLWKLAAHRATDR